MNAITVCVDYHDYLALTLPQNTRHFDKLLVVTSLDDRRTPAVALQYADQGVDVYATDAFTRDGAAFNKGLAIEEGLDILGRENLLCCLDADIVLPEALPRLPECGVLGMPRRRQAKPPGTIAVNWNTLEPTPEMEFVAGYCLFFHADDPVLWDRPWFPMHWKHAGGYDTDFCDKWPVDKRVMLPFNVLHLGEPCKNWWGRTTDYLDGSTPEVADERRDRMRQMYVDRQKFGFSREKLG